ncbi:MAG: Ldh family oxidoreductase [Chloroflexi bacterium]|nr:Ldh family oxidoreductase [Chloroflexota bacterium]
MPFIPIEKLRDFGARVFIAAGAEPDIARRVMTNLVRANTYGIHSHGVVRFADYVNAVKRGQVKANARPVIVQETAVITVVDGRWGFGQVAAEFAMQQAIEKAKATGVGIATLRNSNHVGAIGEYTEMAADAGLIGIAIVNGIGKLVAPFGGRQRQLSTNPFAFSVPVPGGRPIIMDFATSVVAEGKLKVARNKGAKVPHGWVLDKNGESTDDPNEFYDRGMLLTLGGLGSGHKGYGLSIMSEIMGGLLSGTGAALLGTAPANGCFFMALQVDAFRPADEFLADVRKLVDELRATPPRPGVERVLVPGDPEAMAEERHRRDGIELDDVTWQTIVDAARGQGVSYE